MQYANNDGRQMQPPGLQLGQVADELDSHVAVAAHQPVHLGEQLIIGEL